MTAKLRVLLVDDEELALKRLARLLLETGKVEIAGQSTDPLEALTLLAGTGIDVVFLDIEMPGLNGFDLLEQLSSPPLVIFTTAFNQYALRAFEVLAIDYLLKPIEPAQLDRALAKLDRIRGGGESLPDTRRLLSELAAALGQKTDYPQRLASRLGEKIEFVDLAQVTHIYAQDKLTFAAAGGRQIVLDSTIQELEQKLDPRKFLRIHRATIVNLDSVLEMHAWFAGRMRLLLKDGRTELTVARDRVKVLKERMGV